MVQGITSDFRQDGFVSGSESPKYEELLFQNGISPSDIIGPGGRIRTDVSPEVINELYALRDDLFSKVGDPLFPDVENDIEIIEALFTDIGLNEAKSPGIKSLQQALGMGIPADVGKLFAFLNKDIQANPRKWIEFFSGGNNREIFFEALKPYLANPKYEKEVGTLLCNLLTLPDSRGRLMDLARRLFLHISSINKAQSGRVLQFIKNPAAIVLLAALSGIGAQDLMLRLGVSARPKEVNEFDRVAKSVQDFGGCLGRVNFGSLCGKDKVDHFIAVCKLHAEYYAKKIDDDQLDAGMANLHFIEDPTGEYDWIHIEEGLSDSKVNDYGELAKSTNEKIIASYNDQWSKEGTSTGNIESQGGLGNNKPPNKEEILKSKIEKVDINKLLKQRENVPPDENKEGILEPPAEEDVGHTEEIPREEIEEDPKDIEEEGQ